MTKVTFILLLALTVYGAASALEIEIDDSEGPEIRDFLNRSAETIKKYWDQIAQYLSSPGWSPLQSIKLVAKKNYGPPAAAGGDTIFYSVEYARERPNDMGMSVHEATHLVQQYSGNSCPGWLTEGIADYIRYFRYSISGDRKPRKPRAGNNGWERGYGDTAYFLDWVQRNNAKNLVPELNKACRESTYRNGIWFTQTKKSVKDNWEEMQKRARSFTLSDLMMGNMESVQIDEPEYRFAQTAQIDEPEYNFVSTAQIDEDIDMTLDEPVVWSSEVPESEEQHQNGDARVYSCVQATKTPGFEPELIFFDEK